MSPGYNGWADVSEAERETLDQWERTMPREMQVNVLALALDYGWEPEDTGGGCDALRRNFPNGKGYWWITEEGGASIPSSPTVTVMLGGYENDGEPLDLITDSFPTLERAMLESLARDHIPL